MTENTRFKYIVCPKCGEGLAVEGNALRCKNRHSYDISSEGYVNLLPPHKKGNIPGDGKDMIRARRNFLSNGYYKALADRLGELVLEFKPEVIADIGCGEGYYTSGLSQSGAYVMGFDISKFALASAAKHYKNTDYCTANLHELPLKNESVDMMFCCFCAYDEKEFARVLKHGGRFVLVTPGRRHLFGLKSVVYDEPYENAEKEISLEGFSPISSERITYTTEIGSHDDIEALFMMTPYYWRSPKVGAERLMALNSLKTEIEFVITVLEKM